MSRSKSEQYRIYGSPERIEWLKFSVGCLICGQPAQVAHVTSGGVGRKADYCHTVGLCPDHHHELHQHGAKTFEAHWGVDLKASAAWIEAKWQEKVKG